VTFRDKPPVEKPPLSAAATTTPAVVNQPPTAPPSPENHGFVEGKDAAQEPTTPPTSAAEAPPAQEEPAAAEPALKPGKKFSIPKFRFIKGPLWIYIAAGVLLLLVLCLAGVFYFLPKADVELTTETQSKKAEYNLVAGKSVTELNEEKGEIPLRTMETNQEGSSEGKATGSKTVGTTAKGSITIYNCTSSEKSYFVGTEVAVASGPSAGKKFKITGPGDKIEVPARTGIAGCQGPGEKEANVESVGIGEEYNVAGSTNFSIGSTAIDDVYGTNAAAFSGGTKKQVTVVSAADAQKLKDELLASLQKKAEEELRNKDSDVVIPTGGIESAITSEVFDKKVDEEAENFKLDLKVKFTASVFSETDMKKYLIGKIEESVPSGFMIDEEGSVVKSEVLEKSVEGLRILGEIEAKLVPSIASGEVKRNVAGKSFSSSTEYLKSLTSVSKAEIKMRPSLFQIFGRMPMRQENISVKIISEQ
jgi:hypothetical protein